MEYKIRMRKHITLVTRQVNIRSRRTAHSKIDGNNWCFAHVNGINESIVHVKTTAWTIDIELYRSSFFNRNVFVFPIPFDNLTHEVK